MRVIVVGAGVGGLTLAQGLHQAGIDVVVHERDSHESSSRGSSTRGQGITVGIDDRGLTALRSCLPAAHLAIVEATMGAQRLKTLRMSDVDGELAVVAEQPHDGTTAARAGWPAHRPLLRAILMAGLEDRVRFDSGFTRFQQRADGTVQAWFADGTTDTADVLVGADGIGSAVRRQYLPGLEVVDTGMRMLMGATPLQSVSGTGLVELIGDGPTRAEVGERTLILAALRYATPPVAARDEWLPALRSRVVDEAADYVMWTLPIVEEELDGATSPAELWHRAQALVAKMHPTLRAVIEAAVPDTIVPIRVGMIPDPPPWPASPVTLLGDAVHAVPGFGANMAMQDAARLCAALVRAHHGEQELLAAIGEYEQDMRAVGADFDATRAPEPAPVEAAAIGRDDGVVSVDGSWRFTIRTPMGDREFTAVLTSDGEMVAGAVTIDEGTHEIAKGTLQGREIEWLAPKAVMGMDMRLSGTVSGHEITAKVKAGKLPKGFPARGTRV